MVRLKIFVHDHFTSFRTILLAFLCLIVVGAFLLSLPISSASGQTTNFLDALFTSSSAVCVTGLIVRDTATHWSFFGQFIILLLIQFGGLGVITIAITTLIFTGRRIGIMQRSTMQDAISAPQIGGIVRFTKFIFLGTILIELLGACLLSTVFIKDYGWLRGTWLSIFHSISAFCNAGFDLLGQSGNQTSLMPYANNPIICITICLLIVAGGIGFLTWRDLIDEKFQYKTVRLQTKIVLLTTFWLILLSFLYFYFIEFTQYQFQDRFLIALFQSITPRTAGFSTINYATMSQGGLLITILLMVIGGAPGSTAGGIKVTSLFVLVAFTNAFIRKKDDVNFSQRRIGIEVVAHAIAILFIYFFLLILGGHVLASVEKLDLLVALFECASALGTVGLSTGITADLSEISKLILISFMWFGRIGVLTIAYATIRTANKVPSRFPTEKIVIG